MNDTGIGFFAGFLIGAILGAVAVWLAWYPGPTTGRVRSAQECVRTATTERELNENCIRYFRPYARFD